MILEAIKYIRSEGKSKEWSIEGRDGGLVHFGNINLIVGKNAAGKSRTLATIKETAELLVGLQNFSKIPYPNARYELIFKEKKMVYEYSFRYDNKEIVDEILKVNGQIEVDRKNKIIYCDSSKKTEPFDFDGKQLATSLSEARSINRALTELHEWGDSLKNAAFTNQIEKNYYLDNLSKLDEDVFNTNEPILLLRTFWKGRKLFGEKFLDHIKEHMDALGYPLQTVDIVEFPKGYSLCVKESELEDITSQIEMSQGMFRALSFIILLNYALLSDLSVCVLVDDMGEGLDFDRSKILIDILVNNINKSNLQLFITTNDRYIMNKVALEYWSILKRHPQKSVIYNYHNSKRTFEEFKYAGLSNFDFLATDFYINGFDDEVEE